jgi:pimeloyl-ACP methyl ester carboxylesterase
MGRSDIVQHSEEKTIKANSIEIVYDTFGQPSDPAMLLVMGLGEQMIAWDEEVCRQLAAKGYWVIRFDNRDIGRSTRFDDAGIPDLLALMQGEAVEVPYTLDDMAKDSVGLLEALEIEAAHIVGVSMGGMIAQTMAINHPERVRTLTSMMSTTGDPGLPSPKPEAVQLLFTPAPTERTAFIEYSVNVRRILGGSDFPLNEERMREIAGRSCDRGLNPAGFGRQLAAVLASGSRKEALKSVDIPTLVIHGDADPLIPVEGGIDTAESISGAQLMIIEGMGHDLPPDIWPQIVEAIAGHAT